MKRDDGVSEIVSFILILAVVAAGIAIFAAAALPELENAENSEAENKIINTLSDLKTGIDQLFLFEKSEFYTLLLPESGTLTVGPAPEITFNHTSGVKTARLLTLSFDEESPLISPITYEGGGVFSNTRTILPHSSSETHAILITTASDEVVLSSNRPILLTYFYGGRETYTNVSRIQLSNSAFGSYWNTELAGITTLTLVDCTITAEAVP